MKNVVSVGPIACTRPDVAGQGGRTVVSVGVAITMVFARCLMVDSAARIAEASVVAIAAVVAPMVVMGATKVGLVGTLAGRIVVLSAVVFSMVVARAKALDHAWATLAKNGTSSVGLLKARTSTNGGLIGFLLLLDRHG